MAFAIHCKSSEFLIENNVREAFCYYYAIEFMNVSNNGEKCD